MHPLNQCLVGWRGDISDVLLFPPSCCACQEVILFEFDSTREVERVLQEEQHVFKQKRLLLEKLIQPVDASDTQHKQSLLR